MNLERMAYVFFIIAGIGWLGAMIYGAIAAMPWGLFGLAAIAGSGILLIKAIRDRLANSEDDHYARTVER